MNKQLKIIANALKVKRTGKNVGESLMLELSDDGSGRIRTISGKTVENFNNVLDLQAWIKAPDEPPFALGEIVRKHGCSHKFFRIDKLYDGGDYADVFPVTRAGKPYGKYQQMMPVMEMDRIETPAILSSRAKA